MKLDNNDGLEPRDHVDNGLLSLDLSPNQMKTKTTIELKRHTKNS